MAHELGSEFSLRKPVGLFDTQLYKEFLQSKVSGWRDRPILVFRAVGGKMQNVCVGHFSHVIIHDQKADGIWSANLAINWALKPGIAQESLISFGDVEGVPNDHIEIELFILEREDPSCESNRVIPMWRIKDSEFMLDGNQENSCNCLPSLILPKCYEEAIEMKIV